jgi:hypothetical protein
VEGAGLGHGDVHAHGTQQVLAQPPLRNWGGPRAHLCLPFVNVPVACNQHQLVLWSAATCMPTTGNLLPPRSPTSAPRATSAGRSTRSTVTFWSWPRPLPLTVVRGEWSRLLLRASRGQDRRVPVLHRRRCLPGQLAAVALRELTPKRVGSRSPLTWGRGSFAPGVCSGSFPLRLLRDEAAGVPENRLLHSSLSPSRAQGWVPTDNDRTYRPGRWSRGTTYQGTCP